MNRAVAQMHLVPIVVALMAVWFLVYGISGITQRPIPNIGYLLGVLALIVGILLLIVVAGQTPL